MHLNGKVNYTPQGVVVVVVPVVVVPHTVVATVVAVAPKIEFMSSMCVITTICFLSVAKKNHFFLIIKKKTEKFHMCVVTFFVRVCNFMIISV